MLAATALAALSIAPALTPAPANEVPLAGGAVVRLVGAEEGAAALGAEDAFTRALGPLDRRVRLGVDRDVPPEEHRAFAAAQARDWPEADAARLVAAIEALRPRLEGLRLPLPEAIKVVRTTGREEAEAAYCRGLDAIVLPDKVFGAGGPPLERLFAHELFHILSRQDPEARRELYAIVGFAPCPEVVPPPVLKDARLTNPDGPTLDHAVTLKIEGRDVRVVPFLYLDRAKLDPKQPGSFFKGLVFRLMVVEPADGDGLAPALRDGEPVLLDPATTPAYLDRIGRNTGYIIHPDEILADNFVHLVFKTQGLKDPQIVEALGVALRRAR